MSLALPLDNVQVPLRSDGSVAFAQPGCVPGYETVRAAPTIEAVAADGLRPEQLDTLLDTKAIGDVRWARPRELMSTAQLPEDEVAAIAGAVSLLAWHRSNRYGGADGAPTEAAMSGWRRKSAAGRTLYPRVDPVAIVLVESADGSRCLLGRQQRYPKGMFTCISGFVEHAESVENAAVREVHEETGVSCGAAALLASQPWPCGRGDHCELMLGCVARAEPEGEQVRDRS